MLSLRILKRSTNFANINQIRNIFNLNFQKFNFARNLSSKSKSNIKDENIDKEAQDSDSKLINLVKEDVPIKISPYFSKAVSEKEKSFSSINISQLVKSEKKSQDISSEQKAEIIKTKQKLAAAKKQSKAIGVIVENIKRELPKEFFRMGLTEQDMSQHHPLVQRALSLDNASISEFKKARMMEIRKIFARHERDTATPPITACALCEQVLALLSHIKKNKNDMTAYMKLQTYLTKRRKYLLYLKRVDFNSYSYIIKYYGLKDFEDPMHKNFKYRPNFGKATRIEHNKRFPLGMNSNN